jgi:hypothetical protein
MEFSAWPKATGDAAPTPDHLVSGWEPFDYDDSASQHRLVEESPAQGTNPAHRQQHVLRSWMIELASLAIAAGFLVAIWIIIGRYDGQPIPEWSLAINLSTLVSFLAVGFRVATISPVAAIMAQQKWLWMSRKPWPLLDLEHIDNASNTITGSTHLLLHGPRSLMAMLGSATLLLALAIGQLVQQAIHTVTCDQTVPGKNASVAVANYVVGKVSRRGTEGWDLDGSGKEILLIGLVNPLGNDTAVPVEGCFTGNCTFAESSGVTYASFGLCQACIDTSSLIVDEKFTWDGISHYANSTLPNGLALADPVSLISGPIDNNFSSESKVFTREFADLAANSISNITILTLTSAPCSDSPGYASCNNSIEIYNLGENLRALAVSCALYPCLQRFHGSVSNSQLDEFVVSTSPASMAMTVNFGDGWPFPNYTALDIPCLLDNQLYDLSNFTALDKHKHSFMDVVVNGTKVSVPYECVYILDGMYAGALGYFSSSTLFSGNCGNSDGILICQQFWLEKFWGSGAPNLTTVSNIMAQFSRVVSGQFRQIGTTLYTKPRLSETDAFAGKRKPALGIVHTTTVCVKFAWAWLLCPVMVYVTAIALLVVTIFRAYIDRDQPIWKSSPLPLLFYTVEEPVPIAEVMDEKQLRELARRKNVQFVRQGELGVVRLS